MGVRARWAHSWALVCTGKLALGSLKREQSFRPTNTEQTGRCQKGGHGGGGDEKSRWRGSGSYRLPAIEWTDHRDQRSRTGNILHGIVVALRSDRGRLYLRAEHKVQSCWTTMLYTWSYWNICQLYSNKNQKKRKKKKDSQSEDVTPGSGT